MEKAANGEKAIHVTGVSAHEKVGCLLYVALTRAKREVVLSSHGTPSHFLGSLTSL